MTIKPLRQLYNNYEKKFPIYAILIFEFYRINSVNWSDVEGMGLYTMDDSNQKRIRIWLLLSGIVAFGSIFAAVWIAVAHWFTNDKTPFSNWPGVALILQNVLIFLSGITYRYAKPPPSEEYNNF